MTRKEEESKKATKVSSVPKVALPFENGFGLTVPPYPGIVVASCPPHFNISDDSKSISNELYVYGEKLFSTPEILRMDTDRELVMLPRLFVKLYVSAINAEGNR